MRSLLIPGYHHNEAIISPGPTKYNTSKSFIRCYGVKFNKAVRNFGLERPQTTAGPWSYNNDALILRPGTPKIIFRNLQRVNESI